jgi:uncharacterized membrane protein
MDNKKRSVAKAFSWRILTTIATILIVYFVTKEWTISLTIGGLEVVVKLIIYYFHERIWNSIKWGHKD